jgi:hypothetical protein
MTMNYQALASQGRYGDTTLVHMTPKEVSGLNALGAAYGRPMTVNPVTGYPEAFNLENLLPMIIGTGLNIASGGALTPLQIGMMTGAGYAVATGDPMKGLTAGVGAAGGAGFGSGLTASGATALPPAASIPDPSVATIGQNFSQAATGIEQLGTEAGRGAFLGTPSGPSFLPGGAPATGIGGIGGLAKSTAMSLAPQISDSMAPKPPPEQVSYMRPYSLDIENVSSTPYTSSAEQSQLTYRFKEEEPFRVARGGHIRYQEGGGVDGGEMSAPVAGVYQNIANAQRMAGLPAIDVAAMAPSLQAQMTAPRSVPQFTAPAMSFKSRDYGIRMPDPTESSVYQNIAEAEKQREIDAALSAMNDMNYAEGGLAGLREGRFLNGEGDGMSDEIPASIEGEVDALLSDGEFVIPADVVSHLGNGSSAAGAKVLYNMMDRIRKERTGQEEQAEEVEVEKTLPA